MQMKDKECTGQQALSITDTPQAAIPNHWQKHSVHPDKIAVTKARKQRENFLPSRIKIAGKAISGPRMQYPI